MVDELVNAELRVVGLDYLVLLRSKTRLDRTARSLQDQHLLSFNKKKTTVFEDNQHPSITLKTRALYIHTDKYTLLPFHRFQSVTNHILLQYLQRW